jgi:hypothetical protein
MSKEDRVTKEMRIQHENKTKFDNIINKTPMLKKLRDQSQGLTYKGDVHSDVPTQEYKDNYDQIDWTQLKTQKKNYRVKVNGRYVDEDKDE